MFTLRIHENITERISKAVEIQQVFGHRLCILLIVFREEQKTEREHVSVGIVTTSMIYCPYKSATESMAVNKIQGK